MCNAKTSVARLISGLLVLSVCGAAAAEPLEGYWESRAANTDAPAGCRFEIDSIVILSRGPNGIEGRIGRHYYRDVQVTGGAVNARSVARWTGFSGSPAVVAELDAKQLPLSFSGRLSAGGDEIVGEDRFYCANHSGDVLNWVRDHAARTTLKRVDLAIGFVQRIDGAWTPVTSVDFGQPFRVEVRPSRALAQPRYPVTLAWLGEARDGAPGASVRTARTSVVRVEGAAPLYRSDPIRFKRPAQDAGAAAAGGRDAGQVVLLAPGTKLYAALGERMDYGFAAEVRAGRLNYLGIGLTVGGALALLAGVGFGTVKAAPAAAAGLGLMRRALTPKPADAGVPDAEDPAEAETEPAYGARSHRDPGAQQITSLEEASPPVIRFRAATTITALRLEPAAA